MDLPRSNQTLNCGCLIARAHIARAYSTSKTIKKSW
ncbi:Bgt-51386 [Blumeria graminis f. sp. tritici]|uniref:Bgt-51386 n=1 Tax=Blumeria graminis f. sp. tritici TaxID=62690 RepID=A0A9X9MJB2_BLUGR|nr:Bgt-51386 [Blumeria graminis f. sp. tritici]